ncbi:DNA replication licensing factor MCM6 [Thelohanellus kitauei]|uniref:DNA replication licensing factor MCM6 n=1 Tax=Thelohanellus kitauei TaxID=669202 RepID=A0A0C2MV96_THEKT|nr:DNA replication licensing factor MCM6 [Thelohanellus kitauei]
MDNFNRNNRFTAVSDELGEKCELLFFEFLRGFTENEVPKYFRCAEKLRDADKNSLYVDFVDIEKYDPVLSSSIQSNYYRVMKHLNNAAKKLCAEATRIPASKEIYVSIRNVPVRYKFSL